MSMRIAIIGSGCSGLAAIKCCLDEGLEPVCLEREHDIGGLWNYADNVQFGYGSIYKSCVMNTSKEMTAFSDFPVPKSFPPFMPHSYVLKYIRMYADNFDLLRCIRFGVSVTRVVPAAGYSKTGCWSVTYRTQETASPGGMPGMGPETSEVFDGVMVCTGHHAVPHMPLFQGLETFQGIKMHSHSYKVPDPLVDKRVLIVGVGNSAVDIAVDLSHRAEQVYISTRNGAWVVSRMGFWGIPTDVLANSRVAFAFSLGLLQWVVEKMANFRFNHEDYGLKPIHRALEAHPTINDELPYKIMTGCVRIKSDVMSFTETGVFFTDGSFEELDAVIFATGFQYRYDFLNRSVMQLEKNESALYKYVFPPDLEHPTLAVIGLVQAVGSVLPISELQSRWFSRIIKGLVHLPSRDVMWEDVLRRRMAIRRQYLPRQRHTLETMWVPYMDEIAEEIRAKPNLMLMALQGEPLLALRCFCGPCVPAQYRLTGPNQWDGARSAIRRAFSNNIDGTKTRTIAKDQINDFKRYQNDALLNKLVLVRLILAFLAMFVIHCLMTML